MQLCLKVLDKENRTVAVSRGEEEVNLVLSRAYEEGDRIILETSDMGIYVWLQLDDALGKSLVYICGTVEYVIPFGERRINLSPKVFSGEKHLLCARKAFDFQVKAYRNLAENVCDQHNLEHIYPHAVANGETRGEAVFAAQNAIDGVTVNNSHGEWPYESWGINRQDDAKIRIYFGRDVKIDRILLYTRADFPHDNWWKQVSFSFSDGSRLEMQMEKSDKPHELCFEEKCVRWVEMHDMKKSEDPSPFPALSQIEVYGVDVNSEGGAIC